MATSEQLEREAEATRAQIAATLDELRGRMTPGQVVDQLVDYARDSGGGEFVRNFGQQVVGNPLPVTLVSAGLAWLMMAGRRGPTLGASVSSGFGMDDVAEGMSDAGRARKTSGQADDGLGATARSAAERTSANVADLGEHVGRRARSWARQTRATAGRFNQGLGEAGAGLQDATASAGANVRDAASSAYDTASATYDAATERARQGADAISRSARMMSDNIAATGQGLLGFLQEQPLVLAGLGLALGAILGGALPSTETEDQLVGAASDTAKRDAKAFAEQQVEKGKAVAEQAWQAAKPELDEQLHHGKDDPAGEATLVPSDQTAQAETAGNGTRRDPEHTSD